jgi:hypothetical protein
MAITKPPVLPAWADAGDKVQPSNAELSVGWPVSSTPPSRQRFNWILNFVANAVRYLSRRGLVDYDAAETYMTGDCVIGDDGKTYRSLADYNSAQIPSTSPNKWERWGMRLSELDGYVALTLLAAPNPIANTSDGFIPVTAAAVAGQGGTVSITAGTAFTLGQEVAAGATCILRNCGTVAFTSPTLSVNSEYFLRAQFVAGTLTFYVQRGALTDATPASQKGTVNGTSGGGFFSTPLDICIARIVTASAGTVPSVQRVINRKSVSWSATLNGNGTIYLPIDPFTKTGRITVGNPTPGGTATTEIAHGSSGWDGWAYFYGLGTTATAGVGQAWSGQPIPMQTNTFASDMAVSTCTGLFNHLSAKSIWQNFQAEHSLGDTTGAKGDEMLFSLGTKTMLQADYDNGLAISFQNSVNGQITWEIVR